jgi:hypothetical protein
MASPPGNFDLRTALNNMLPVTSRAKLGDVLNTLINAVNALAAQADIGLAVDAGATYSTTGGTLTVAGTITNGNWVTVTFVNASLPLLVTPGLVVGPINIVTGDTVTTFAAKLVVAINTNQTLTNYGYVASNSAGVVTAKALGAIGNSTVMTAQLSAGATITVTPVNPSGGAGAVVARNTTAYALTPLSRL